MGNFFFIAGTPVQYDATEDGYSTSFSEPAPSGETPSVSYLDEVFGSELAIPVSIFRGELTAFQNVVKFLRENKGLSNSEIGKLLSRDSKSIWVAYEKTRNKSLPQIKKDDMLVPVSIFSGRDTSCLEALVEFLKRNNLSFAQIARIIRRDQRTVWTAHSRYLSKRRIEDDQ